MNNTGDVGLLGSLFVAQLPVLLVCLVAGVMILTTWERTSRGYTWALLGFGLALLLCFAVPLGQVGARHWVGQGNSMAQRAVVFTGLAFFWSLLRAASYALLLAAVLAGRSSPPAPPSLG